MNEQTKPTFSLADLSYEITPEEEKRERLATPRGMALVCFCHGEGVVLQWQANQALRNYMEEITSNEAFPLSDFDPEIKANNIPDEHLDQYNRLQSGIFIARLSLVDAGPESWEMPHIRDIVLGVKILRSVSKEEWHHYLRDEWAWDFEEEA